MANIPLTEIPNAPQSGNPTMQNVNIPTVNLAFAERQIKEGYQGQMLDMKAAAAPGYALQQVGQDMVNIGSLTTDTMRKYVETEDAIATNRFLVNLDGIRSEIKMAQAGTDPAMYPTIVAKAYENEDRLYEGIGGIGRRMIQSDVLRAKHNDIAEAGIAAHIAAQKQTTASSLYAMQSNMQRGNYDDALTLNDNLFRTGQIGEREFVSNKINIDTSQQTSRFMDIVNANPKKAMRMVNNALVSGQPISGFENISSPEMLQKLTRITEAADIFQTAEKVDAVRGLVDSYTISSVDALNANPVFMQLDEKSQDALRSRVLNLKVGTPEAEASTKEGYLLVDRFPQTDNVVTDYAAKHDWITRHVPSPHAEAMIKALDDKKDVLAQNAGQLPAGQDLKRHTADLLQAYRDSGMFGELPQASEKGTLAYANKELAILRRMEDIKQAVLDANPKTRAEVESAVSLAMTPEEASKLAKNASPGFWNWLLPPQKPVMPPASNDADEPLPPIVPPDNYDTPPGFKRALATSFGTNVDGTPDLEDGTPGKYLKEKTHDPNFMAASLSEKALAEEGIPVEQAGNYDVIVRNEANGKELKVPIGDLGPAPEIEDRQGRTVDFTGAVHRALGTKGKDKVIYRVVPRGLSEG